MLLCLDAGNTHIHAGVMDNSSIKLRLRYPTKELASADQLGVFFRAALREGGVDPHSIDALAIASVVPSIDYTLRSCAVKYFSCEPFFLRAGVKTGLKIATANPSEVGADLVASAVAAVGRYPQVPIIVVDFGTATTFVAISPQASLLGAVFMPGLATSMGALQHAAAKLPAVEIVRPSQVLGRSTMQCIQSGLYHMQLASAREIVAGIIAENFARQAQDCVVLGTGGFAHLYADSGIFTAIAPDLVLEGIEAAYTRSLQAKLA